MSNQRHHISVSFNGQSIFKTVVGCFKEASLTLYAFSDGFGKNSFFGPSAKMAVPNQAAEANILPLVYLFISVQYWQSSTTCTTCWNPEGCHRGLDLGHLLISGPSASDPIGISSWSTNKNIHMKSTSETVEN